MQLLASLAVAGALLSTPTRAAAADRIDLRDGKAVIGKIQRETPTDVTIQGTAGPQTVPVNQIAGILYEGQGPTLIQAKAYEESYNYTAAAEQFAKAEAELKDKPLILQAAQFGQARALAKRALDEYDDLDGAIRRLDAFHTANAQSRHHFPLHELLGRLYFAKKDHARAGQAFEELGRAPWPETKLRATVYQGRLLVAQGNLDQALTRFDEVLATKAASPEQELAQTEALLEKARCFHTRKQHDREIEALEQVIDRAPPNAIGLQGEAYATLGDALRAANKPKDALVAYLHVEILFSRDKELHARALYNLAQLWSELGQPDRAATARSTLKTDYPNSPWTKKLGS